MNILNVGYDSTNYYLLGDQAARLLIDVGWPGTLPKLLGTLKRKGVALKEVAALLVTHYHPDHAGLAQELKEQGVQLIVLETQVSALPELRRHIKPSYPYKEISLNGNVDLTLAQSRSFLRRTGISGEIISTPGHSADSVTLILDEGAAFTGDLTRLGMATEEAQREVELSWEKIRAHQAKTIYPGHGPAWRLE
jgi:endoribonuclease LACTB2